MIALHHIRVLTALGLFASISATCLAKTAHATTAQEIINLRAFAKLFGYIRYFHPSDEAQQIDWDRFAIYGAEEVLRANDLAELQTTLDALFRPLAPTLELYIGEARPASIPERPESEAQSDDAVMAWQHLGVGLDGSYVYRSARTNRESKIPLGPASFGNVMQNIRATELQGKPIRMQFRARLVDGDGQLQGWLRVDRPNRQMGYFDNMQDRPIREHEWDEYTIEGIVDADGASIAFGILLAGTGTALVDDVQLSVQENGAWQPTEIKNPSFEQNEEHPVGWITGGQGYQFTLVEQSADSERAVQIERSLENVGHLFDATPALGEVVDKELASGLRCRFPLALPAGTPYERGASLPLESLRKGVLAIKPLEMSQSQLSLGDVVIAWNVFQHFYPYFDQVETDWLAALDEALQSALADESAEDTYKTVSRLVAHLHDGHGFVMHPVHSANQRFLPVAFDWIEDQLVVVATEDERVQLGDVVTTINERSVLELIEESEPFLSGSPQFKRRRATLSLARGPDGEAAYLTVQRGAVSAEIVLIYDRQMPPSPAVPESFEEVADGVLYVNLNGTSATDVQPHIEAMATAKAVIFDLRGYPNGTHFLLQHMTDEPLTSQQWLVPQRIYPDQERLVDYNRGGRWQLPPIEPRFKGQMVFLTNASAISYAESVLSIVAHYQLAEIVGQPTAGANGNVNPFTLPDGTRVAWTGMRVINHDGSQHHVRGVQPTVRVEPTVAAIREGRDEYLEQALQLVE